MCNGTIMDKLISFALPLMLSGILQLMFNAVDIVVVGRFSGSESLAAVGSTTALINIFTNLFIGISLGRKRFISPLLCGRQEKRNVRDGTYRDFVCASQWDCDGSCRGGFLKMGTKSDGNAG